MNPNIRRLVVIGLAVIAGVALLAVALPQLWYPLWFDQGALAACADVLRRGGALYRDCWEVRGPAAVLAYAIPMLVSPSPVAIHAFDLVWQALTALLLALLARKLFGTRAGIAAAVLYWLMYASINYWATAQAESFANLFFVLALYAGWMAVGENGERRLEIRDWKSEDRSQRSEVRDQKQEVRGKRQEVEGQTLWYAHRVDQDDTDVNDNDDDDEDDEVGDVVVDEDSILESPIPNLQSPISTLRVQSQFIWLAISGACVGVLFWFKYPFALIGLVPLGLLLARTMLRRRMPPAAQSPISTLRAQSLLPFLLGGLAVLGLGLACFAVSGALPSLQAQITYDITTFNNVPLSERLVWLRTTYWEEIVAFVGSGNTPTAGFKDTVAQLSILGRGYPFVFALLAIGLVAGLWRRNTRAAALYGLGYFVAAIAISLWQGHFYRYHFLIALPAIALIAAGAIGEMRLEIRDLRLNATRGDSRLLRTQSPISNLQSLISNLQSLISNLQSLISNLLLAAAAVGLAAAMLPWVRDAYVNVVIQQKPAASLYQESRLADYSLLAAELVQRTAPRDRIVIFSDVPAVYVLAQRPNGTRFPYMRWAQEAGSDAIRDEYAQEFLDDLTRSRARFFVLTQTDYPWAGADFIGLWKSMPAIHDYVEKNYHYVGENGPFLIFQRSAP
ncbi:MAG: hypothetical protein M1434_09560 [Chloroflexi bacterium]|nr:hypothetical protein [Chloroflexota bacterium]MCL5274971.1 hypothetical protein [Chloroflexota bacterium]